MRPATTRGSPGRRPRARHDHDATPPRRASVLLGAALAGCTLITGSGVAQAATWVRDPYVFLVDGERAVGRIDGLDVFQVDRRDIGVAVVSGDGRLEIRDEDGYVVCTDPTLDASSDPCPVHMEPGEHRLTATVTRPDGESATSAPVIVQSSAAAEEPGEHDGLAPAAPSVLSVSSGPRPGLTRAVLAGQAGDRVLVHSEGQSLLGEGSFDADGRFVVDVPTWGEDAVVTADTRRSGQRLLTELSVADGAAAPVPATPLRLEGVERLDEATARITLRGVPGQGYQLRTEGRWAETEGTVPEDGTVRWTLPVRRTSFWMTAHAFGTLDQDIAYLHVDVPAVDPGAGPGAPGPVVADPGDDAVDPGFTVGPGEGDGGPGDGPGTPAPTDPVVAEPGDGAVDPGFTARPGDPEPADPVVARPVDDTVDPGFTASPHAPEVSVVLLHPAHGGTAILRVADPGAGPRGYDVHVRVDGRTVDVVTVTTEGARHTLHGLGTGTHTVEYVAGGVHGTVVASVEVTL